MSYGGISLVEGVTAIGFPPFLDLVGPLVLTVTNGELSWESGGGGGGTPGGSNTQLQYNNAGAFGGAVSSYDAAQRRFTFGSNTAINGTVAVYDDTVTTGVSSLVVRAGAGQASNNLQSWKNNAGTDLTWIRANGGFRPVQLADASATNDSVFYSTTGSKVAYKDSGGAVTYFGSASPGGSNTQPQYNNAGAFAGMSGWSWADGTKQLTLTGVGFRQSGVGANYFSFINAAGNEVASINDAGVSLGFWNLSIPASNAGWRITAATAGTLLLSSGLAFSVQTVGSTGSLTLDNTKLTLNPSVTGSTIAEQVGGITGASAGAQFQTLHKERWWTYYWNGVSGFNNHTLLDFKLIGQSTTPSDSLYQISSAGLGLTLLSLNTLNGNLAFADGASLIAGTTNGLKIGGATSQKLGLWNATPIVQPTTGVAAATLVSNGGTTLTDTDTFDGYTLKQVVKALRTMGALA